MSAHACFSVLPLLLPLSHAMPLTASCAGASPSPVASSPPASYGDFSDPSHPLPSFAFVILQLSSLLVTTCSDSHGAYARQQLLFALSNVLFTSLHSTSPSTPSSIIPAVQATPAPIVPIPVTESPSPPLPTPPPRTSAPSPSPRLTIRVLTPVQPFTPAPRRSRRKRRRSRSRSCPPSPAAGSTLAASPNPPAPLAYEVKEIDSSNGDHRAYQPSSSARSSSETVDSSVASEQRREAPTTTTTTPTIATSSSETERHCHPSRAASTHPSPTGVLALAASPNPFAPLADEVGEVDIPNDVQRAPTLVSACLSSVAVASSANSNVDVKVDDSIAAPACETPLPLSTTAPSATPTIAAFEAHSDPAGPKPVEIATKGTASKRPCTRSCTATTPTHCFFQRLSSRPASVRAHFEKHYLPTSRMCSCDLFPVYASKVDGVAGLPPELDAFCLQCITANVLTVGKPLMTAFNRWAPGFVTEVEANYIPFYGKKEKKDFEKPTTELEKENIERRWMCLLERMGFIDR